jgi:hypothetical protein
MASSLWQRLQGRDPEKEAALKKQADAAAAQYGEAPEEAGVEEDSFLPDPDLFRNQENASEEQKWLDSLGPGTKMLSAALPPPTAMGAAGEAESAATGRTSFIKKLRDTGMPEADIEKAAQELRFRGHTTIPDPEGGALKTIGQNSPDGQDLKYYGKIQSGIREREAPTYNYSNLAENKQLAEAKKAKAPRVSGEAKEFFERTGVDPTRKSAVDTMRELREKRVLDKAQELVKSRGK